MKTVRNKAWGIGLTLIVAATLMSLWRTSNPPPVSGYAGRPQGSHNPHHAGLVVVAGSGTPAIPESPHATEGERSTFEREPSLVAGSVKGVPLTAKERQQPVPQKSQELSRHNPAPAPRAGLPGRVLAVPAGLAHRPLPLFIRQVEVSGKVELRGALSGPSPQSPPALPAEREEQVLQEAERIFAKAMAPAPEESADPETYENWWRAAQERSENYLRLALGWDRFITLTREGAAMETLQMETRQNSLVE